MGGVRDLPVPITVSEEATSRSLLRRERFPVRVSYWSSVRTDLGFRLACASMAVLDCIRIWFFV